MLAPYKYAISNLNIQIANLHIQIAYLHIQNGKGAILLKIIVIHLYMW